MHLMETTRQQRFTLPARLTLVQPHVNRQVDAPAVPYRLGGLAGQLFHLLRNVMQTFCANGHGMSRKPELRVIETLNLGPKKQIVLVSCKGERFLVGTGAESVDTIVRLRTAVDEDNFTGSQRGQLPTRGRS